MQMIDFEDLKVYFYTLQKLLKKSDYIIYYIINKNNKINLIFRVSILKIIPKVNGTRFN